MSTTAAQLHRPQPYTVVLPARLAEPRPTAQVYVRRRLLVGLVLLTVVFGVWFSAGNVLANRGGEPASAAAVRPATCLRRPARRHPVVHRRALTTVRTTRPPTSTCWSVLNGGTVIQVGQSVTLSLSSGAP